MADRYQGRPFRTDDDDRGYGQAPQQAAESDPLAELARLIGQTDPFASVGRPPAQPDDDERPAPPSWMQRVNQRETVKPVQYDEPAAPARYADETYTNDTYTNDTYAEEPHTNEAYGVAPVHHGQAYQEQAYAPAEGEAAYDQNLDPSRYDDALYGPADDANAPAFGQHPAAYAGGYDPQQGYDDGAEIREPRRGGMTTVIAVLALAFVGTAGAYAYRTYTGSPRNGGEIPIIKADTTPNKVVPASADGKAIQDRIPTGPNSERIVSREEQPVDVNAARGSGPRVVFPPLAQNPNPGGMPTGAAIPPGRPATGATSGTLGGDEPHKVKTVSIRPDQADLAAMPATPPIKPPPPAPRAAVAPQPAPVAAAPAPAANAPMSLSPQAAAPAPAAPTRIANTAPPAAPVASASTGGYVVQVSSQRSEADAASSFRSLQGKFPSVLGSRAPLIKRADLGDKGVYYRAMVGPFGTPDEASQFCGSLKTAGGQCVVQRN